MNLNRAPRSSSCEGPPSRRDAVLNSQRAFVYKSRERPRRWRVRLPPAPRRLNWIAIESDQIKFRLNEFEFAGRANDSSELRGGPTNESGARSARSSWPPLRCHALDGLLRVFISSLL